MISVSKITDTAFNRTIVELKLRIQGSYVFARLTFNRTIVELKYAPLITSDGPLVSFNRTIVELKLDKREEMCAAQHLLIVP